MTRPGSTIDVTQRLEISASRERVFELLTEREQLDRWWPAVVTFEPRLGGRFEMVAGEWRVAGEITELDPPQLVTYTWRYRAHPRETDPGDAVTEVRFELHESSGGGTTLTLTHTGFLSEPSRGRHEAGWTHHLGRLQRLAEGAELEPDQWTAGSPG